MVSSDQDCSFSSLSCGVKSQPAQSEHPRSLHVGYFLPFFLPQSLSSSSLAHLMPSLRISLFRLISVSGNFPFFLKMILKHSPKTLRPTNMSAAMNISISQDQKMKSGLIGSSLYTLYIMLANMSATESTVILLLSLSGFEERGMVSVTMTSSRAEFAILS